MAHVMLFRSPGNLVQHLYLVTSGVGAGRPNQRDDVLLVQFFLRALSKREAKMNESLRLAGAPELAIDGIWGPNSADYLKHFVAAREREERGGQHQNSVPWSDGAVDAKPPGGAIGQAHGRRFAIIALNTDYAFLNGKQAHAEIFKDPLFPAQLAERLFI